MNPYTRSRGISFLLFTCALMAIMLACIPALAQVVDTNNVTGTNAPPDAAPVESAGQLANSLLMLAISIVTPMLVRLGKFALPKTPTWLLPIIAPTLVAVANWLSGLMGGPHINPLLAALLGAAGTGIREIKDQIGQRVVNGPNPTVPPGVANASIVILIGVLSLGTLTGCKTPHLEAGGVYAPTNAVGQVVYNNLGLYLADASYKFTREQLSAVLKFERDNRKAIWLLSPDVKHALDTVRKQANEIDVKWAESRKLYKSLPTPEGLSTLQDILTVAQNLLEVAQLQVKKVPAAVGKKPLVMLAPEPTKMLAIYPPIPAR